MARQETYGNWLGPPAVPPKGLVRQPGIYSAGGKMSPVGDFRPGSPDSFEDDDYDDVSLPGPGTVYSLAGSPKPSQSCSPGNPPPDPTPLESAPHSREAPAGPGRAATATATVTVTVTVTVALLVALGVAGTALGVGMGKYREIVAELELLKSNLSEIQDSVRRELQEVQALQTRLRSGIQRHFLELQDITGLLCRTLEGSRRCSAGWRIFGKSCYSFSREFLPWREARDACADLGAHLVVVNSEREQEFLVENMNGSDSHWLGVTDQEQEGKWVWINGERPSVSFWQFWKENKDKELKDCGALGPDGSWSNELCSSPRGWICEKSWNC